MGSETDDSASETGFFENPGNVAILSSVIGVVTLGSAAAIVFKVIRCGKQVTAGARRCIIALWFMVYAGESDFRLFDGSHLKTYLLMRW